MNRSILIPAAIVLAGALAGGGILLASARTGPTPPPNPGPAGELRPVGPEDFVRGNPAAAVTIVEFSDFECPFCARLHPTLARLVAAFPDVRWVYRHFPLSSIHARAFGAAEAAECIGKLAGNSAFWSFADDLFDRRGRIGDGLYRELAEKAGISSAAFDLCRKDPATRDAVSADLDEALALGGRGTPFMIVVTATGRLIPVSGALPYERLAAIAAQALEL